MNLIQHNVHSSESFSFLFFVVYCLIEQATQNRKMLCDNSVRKVSGSMSTTPWIQKVGADAS